MTGAADELTSSSKILVCLGAMDGTTAGLFAVASLHDGGLPVPSQDDPLADVELARKRSAVECFAECATKLFPRIGV
jgi:hypothetical protein